MKIIADLVITLDGYIARENGEEDFLPSEGWDEFVEQAKKLKNIVMGRETFELVMKLYPDYNFDSVPVDNKIIISRDKDYDPPEGYTAVTSPESAVDLLKEKETETMYIIGGGKIVTYFVATGLADELHLTINPYILGKGRPFINSDSEINRKLELVESEQLEDGRLFVKYKIIK